MRMRLWPAAAIVMLAASTTALAADSPWTGTWKMDPAQSKLTGETVHFTSTGDGEMTITVEGHTSMFKLDGNAYKTWSGTDATWKKVDDNTFEEKVKANGVDLVTATWTVSSDGKTMQEEAKGKNPDGSSFDDTDDYVRTGGTKGLAGSWKSTKTKLSEEQTYEIAVKGPNELEWSIPAIKGVLNATLDGKEHTVDGPTIPKGLTIALTRVSPRELKMTQKLNGEVIAHSTMTLSPDGKKMIEVSVAPKTNETTTSVWLKQ
jgi:hypothetical protein